MQQLVDEGRISKEEAGRHPQRSVVTRVMTGQPDDEPDTSLREAKLGDRFLLCSDGLSDFVGAGVIEEILRGAATPADAAERCIEVALKASTRDNVTVIVADVVDADGDDLPPRCPRWSARQRAGCAPTRPIPTSPQRRPRRSRVRPPPAPRNATTRSSSPSRGPARAAHASSDSSSEPSSSWPCSPPGGMPPGPGPSASSMSRPRAAASRSSGGCRRTSGRSASRGSRARRHPAHRPARRHAGLGGAHDPGARPHRCRGQGPAAARRGRPLPAHGGDRHGVRHDAAAHPVGDHAHARVDDPDDARHRHTGHSADCAEHPAAEPARAHGDHPCCRRRPDASARRSGRSRCAGQRLEGVAS